MTELLNIINSFQVLDFETEQVVRRYFVEERFKKNEVIIREGKICSKIYFIKSGLVRRVLSGRWCGSHQMDLYRQSVCYFPD